MDKDLLQQAVRLATLDPTRPRQANVRRAVSSVYYALFHLLVDEATRVQIGAQHNQASFRQVLGRAFVHGVMKEACKSFGGGSLKKGVAKGLPASFAIPIEIRELAAMFVDLQDHRHAADYDLTERFQRSDVLLLIRDVERRIQDFNNLASSTKKRFFLACVGLEGPGEPLRARQPAGGSRAIPLSHDPMPGVSGRALAIAAGGQSSLTPTPLAC